MHRKLNEPTRKPLIINFYTNLVDLILIIIVAPTDIEFAENGVSNSEISSIINRHFSQAL